MGKPTVEEYKKALQERDNLRNWLRMEYNRRDEYLDELINTRENINTYQERFNKANEIIQKYEIYQKVEREMRGG